MDLGKFKLHI